MTLLHRGRRYVVLAVLTALPTAFSAHACAQDATARPGLDKKLHIYLLIGQSNMAGRAPIPGDATEPIDRCLLLDDQDQWQAASPPLNRFSTIRKGLGMQKLNPGYSFAKTMLAADQNVKLGLVVNAKGGTSILQWKKGQHFYNEAIRRTRIAAQSGTLKGILWHQGESDQTDPDYLTKMKQLVSDLRQDLGIADLPFVAGQIQNVPLINEQIAQLPDELPRTGYAGSEGLQTMDRWHFDTPSMLTLGRRYAEAMRKIQQSTEKD